MIHLYGSPLSSPVNKVRYVANYLNLAYEFHFVNLAAGEQRKPEYLKINPYGRVPAMDDNGFMLAESNAIIRYLATKAQTPLYPIELQQRAVIDQWIDFASHHVSMSLSKIIYNKYFYQLAGVEKDERALEDGHKFINQFLPIIEQQLTQHAFIASSQFSLADIAMLAALDVSELCDIDLSHYTHICAWRKKLMAEKFYKDLHLSYTDTFNQILKKSA
jgi:glutathione S-transferase